MTDRDVELRQDMRQVIAEVRRERETQDEKWGGADHDDGHDEWTWIALLTKHAGRGAPDAGVKWRDRRTFRQQMIRVAALAVAAAEWSDRRVIAELAQVAMRIEEPNDRR